MSTTQTHHSPAGTLNPGGNGAPDANERRLAGPWPRESDERYRNVFERAAVGMAIVDCQGSFLQVNPAVCEIVGYTEAEMLAGQIDDLACPEDMPAILDQRRRMLDGEMDTIQIEMRCLHQRGHPVWVLLSSALVRDADGEPSYFIIQIQDITSRKLADEALNASERRFREVLETVQIVAVVLNRMGCVAFCNDFLLRLTGRERNTVLGRPWFDMFLPAEVREVARSAFFRSMERGRAFLARHEHPLVTKTGEQRTISWNYTLVHDAAGKVVGATMIGEDVTDRRRLEGQLAESLRRERHIAETLQRSLLLKRPDPIISGLEIETFYLPALDEAQVGGDFFDVFALDGERIALALGDASGKGLMAAARVVEVKFALRAFLREYPHPARTLSRLNDLIYNSTHLEKRVVGPFVVLSLAVVNTATGETFFSCAGSEPPLVLRAEGSGEMVQASGLPLCIQPDEYYETARVYLSPGDLILMATDGITEARRRNEFLGVEGLLQLAQDALPLRSLRAISESIVEGARAYTSRGAFTDDACLLLARL